eukprot:6443652-Pyramimonas_sp.AAC.1
MEGMDGGAREATAARGGGRTTKRRGRIGTMIWISARRRMRGGVDANPSMQMTNVVNVQEINSLLPSWSRGATKPAQAGANLKTQHGMNSMSRGSIWACART